jgi:hypothetical protein
MKYTDLLAMWNNKNSFVYQHEAARRILINTKHWLLHGPKMLLFNFVLAVGSVMYHKIHKVKTSVPKVKFSLGDF